MIDLHCHLLPGIDDGPATLDDALALARALVADGVRHVVATPHIFPGRYENKRSGIAHAHAAFAQVLAQQGIGLQLSFAGEVRLSPDVLDWLARGELPFLGGDAAHAGQAPRVLLLEMPDGQVPLGTDRLCASLSRQGIVPLIAHPERNRGVMEQPERLEPLLDAGCQFQLTAGSLLGDFGSRAQDTAWDLLERGQVAAVASDAHNLRGRAPRMSAARELLVQEMGEAVARRLTQDNPARLCGLVG
jgi:protein-tyrosine phosphatase